MQDMHGVDLYALLEVSRDATPEELKKAYRRLALKHHPDKNKNDPESTKIFQRLSFAHSILSDGQKRAIYDRTGDVDDDISADWFDYWRSLFPKVTVEDIQRFEKQYKGSNEERDDVLKAYKSHKGSMKKIMDSIMLVEETEEDDKRLRQIIDDAIASGEVPKFAAYNVPGSTVSKKKSQQRKKKLEDEAAEASALLEQIRGNMGSRGDRGHSSLSTHRERQFNGMVEALEQKYAKQGSKRKRKPKMEPSDEDFERIQRELETRRKTKKG